MQKGKRCFAGEEESGDMGRATAEVTQRGSLSAHGGHSQSQLQTLAPWRTQLLGFHGQTLSSLSLLGLFCWFYFSASHFNPGGAPTRDHWSRSLFLLPSLLVTSSSHSALKAIYMLTTLKCLSLPRTSLFLSLSNSKLR